MPDVEGGSGGGGELEVGEVSEGAAEDEDGVWGTGVGPGVTAGTCDGNAEAPAAETSGDDSVAATAFEGYSGGNAVPVGLVGEEVAHAAEVAFAFFSYVCGEEDGNGQGDVGVADGRCYCEQAGESGTVVADSGREDAGAVWIFGWVTGGSGGEDGVQMGRDKEARG